MALEFSSALRSVALADEGRVLARAGETAPRSVGPLRLVERVLQEAGRERENVECLAVGLGPGSYTGIRAAISLAQGWQLASGVRLVGLSSTECLARQAQAAGMAGEVGVVVDAQRGEFYLARYRIGPHDVEGVEPLRLARPEEIVARAAAGIRIVGPDEVVGCGSFVRLWPDAATLARLASKCVSFVSGAELEPIYLRKVSFRKAPPARTIPPL